MLHHVIAKAIIHIQLDIGMKFKTIFWLDDWLARVMQDLHPPVLVLSARCHWNEAMTDFKPYKWHNIIAVLPSSVTNLNPNI